jgi:activating signal cointegrator 1
VKVLTLHQPWASLVALGVKTIETRSWSTKYRGPLAIHAGARKPRNVWAQERPDLYDPIAMERYLEITEDAHGSGSFLYEWRGPLGAIVATCTLVDVVPTENVRWDQHHHAPYMGYGEPRIPAGVGPFDTIFASEDQRPYGDFTPGRYAYLLADVVPVDPPAPFRGGQGLTRTWERAAA